MQSQSIGKTADQETGHHSDEKSGEVSLAHFNPFPLKSGGDYYVLDKTEVRLLHKGVDLLTAYYQLKYSTMIVRPHAEDGGFKDVPEFLDCNTLTLIREAAKRNKDRDFRCTYVLITPGPTHKVSLTYILENKIEALLYIDTAPVGSPAAEAALLKYGKKNTITIYTHNELQKDHNSCGVMSVILGRDITSKNLDEKNYKHEKLLSFLQEHSDKTSGLLKTKLPPYLMKISQFPEKLNDVIKNPSLNTLFVNQHKGNMETLEAFRSRYKREKFISSKGCLLTLDCYPSEKGNKYKNLIIALFYLEQIKALFLTETGFELSNEAQLRFIKDTKKLSIGPLMIVCNDFLTNAIANKETYKQDNQLTTTDGVNNKPKKQGFLSKLFFKKTNPLNAKNTVGEPKKENPNTIDP